MIGWCASVYLFSEVGLTLKHFENSWFIANMVKDRAGVGGPARSLVGGRLQGLCDYTPHTSPQRQRAGEREIQRDSERERDREKQRETDRETERQTL